MSRSQLLAVFTVVLCLTLVFMFREHTFYFYDFASYERMAGELHGAMTDGGVQAVARYVQDSLAHEYNVLFALPTIAVMHLLTPSRVSFILGLTLPFITLWVWACAVLAARVTNRPLETPEVLAILLVPLPWAISLRGIPDVAGLAALAWATAFWLGHSQRHWWRTIAAGALCGLAFVLRKPFLFSLGGFFVAAGVDCLVGPRRAFPHLVAAALTAVTTAVALEWRFLASLRGESYQQFYGSYLHTPGDTASFIASHYGGLVLGGALVGHLLVLARSQRDARFRASLFTSTMTGTWFLIWIFRVRQTATHHALGPLPIWCGVGLVFVLQWLAQRGGRGVVSLRWALVALLGWVYASCLFPTAVGRYEVPGWIDRALLTQAYPALVRDDFDEVLALVKDLEMLVRPGDSIYVVASSITLNHDVIADAEMRNGSRIQLPLLAAPEIDGRDAPPFDVLGQADLIVMADPFQHHLPSGQRVVESVHSLLDQAWFADEYMQVSREYLLGDGVRVRVLRRRGAAHPAIWGQAITELVHDLPSMGRYAQPEWLIVAQGYGAGWLGEGAGGYRYEGHLGAAGPAERRTLLVTTKAVEAGDATLSVELVIPDPRCAGALLELSALSATGDLLASQEARRPPGTHEVELTLEVPATAYLQLELRTSALDGNIYFCSVSLRRMRLGDRAVHSRAGSEQDENAAAWSSVRYRQDAQE